MAKQYSPKALLTMDYFMTASLLKQYCGDTPLEHQAPFFKGIRFYSRFLWNFYFHVDVYTSRKVKVNGFIEETH